MAFCDNSGEFLAGLLRAGNAGANAAADQITVLDQALAQGLCCILPMVMRRLAGWSRLERCVAGG